MKKQKPLYKQVRSYWGFNPVTRVIPCKKIYSRKNLKVGDM